MKKISYLAVCLASIIILTACSTKPGSSEKVSTRSVSEQKVETDNKKLGDTTKAEQNNNITQQSEQSQTSQNAVSSNTNNTNTKVPDNKTSVTPQSSTTPKTTNSSNAQSAPKPTGKVIVIDPGHANRSNLEKEPLAPGSSEMKIKDGGGAQGVATRTPEYRLNMNVAVKVRDILQSNGYTVIMTKTQDSQSLGNVERANIWNNANAALALRIHADSSVDSSVKGASMLVPAAINESTKAVYAASKSYGKTVLDTLVSEVGMTNRGITEHTDMTGFNWTKVPVILVEMGFLSNPDEDRLLSSTAYEDKLAKALADGVMNAVK